MGKISRPILPEVFPRQRLFEALDKLRRQPMIWVSGPGGCGKTTLISSYLDDRKLPCLWYQVEEGDKDPATFFYYLGQAAKNAFPKRKIFLPLFTSGYSRGLPPFAQNFFEKLFSRVTPPFKKGGNQGGFVLVFDNFQEAPEGSPLSEILLHGLSRVPEGVNFLILSRRDPPDSLIRLRANDQMALLGWDELRLNLSEAEGIVRLRAPELHSREVIRDLHTESDGWAAGLVLMVEKRKIEKGELGALKKRSREDIFAYFAGEILRKADPETQDFLCKTSLFPMMTARMAEEFTGLSTAGSILSALNKDNFFTEKRIQKEAIYQFHPMFREFLIARAESIFSGEAGAALKRRAAKILEENEQYEAAVSLLMEMNDWDGMLRLTGQQAPSMFFRGRDLVLREWLQSIPESILENNPWHVFYIGSTYLGWDPPLARSYLEKALVKFRSRNCNRIAGMVWSLSSLVESIAQEGVNLKLIDPLFPVFEELTKATSEFPSEEIELRFAHALFTGLLYRQPHNPEIEKWADRALGLVEKTPNPYRKFQTLSTLVHYYLNKGDLERAAYCVDSMERLSQLKETPLTLRVWRMPSQAHYCHLTGLHEKCFKIIPEGLELSRTTGIHVLDGYLLSWGGAIALSLNDPHRAAEFLNEMASFTPMNPWTTILYQSLKMRENIRLGNLNQALSHADAYLRLAEEVGFFFEIPSARLFKAIALHELRRHKEAEKHLEEGLKEALQIRAPSKEFSAYLLKAHFASDLNQEQACLAHLRKAFPLGREKGYYFHFIDRPNAMANLCIKALEAGIEVEYVREFIRRLKIIPDPPPQHLENWPWPLKIITLGRFGLLKNEKPLRFARKVQQRPLALLKALIALGGKEVKEEEISDSLWPEADGDAAHKAFMINLHRLRQLLGDEKLILHREGRLSLDVRQCWVDAWAFEKLLEEAEATWKKGAKEKAIQLSEKGLEMYRGDFLADWDETLTRSPRERLKSKLIRSVDRMAGHWEKIGQFEKAAEACEKALEANDLIEDFYRRLMVCYARLGKRAEALGVYRRCRKSLSSVLGIDPCLETEKIHKALISEEKAQVPDKK